MSLPVLALLGLAHASGLVGPSPVPDVPTLVAAETWGGHTYVQLDGVDAAQVEAVAPGVPLNEDRTAWAGVLPVDAVSGHAVGETWQVASLAGDPVTCRVTRFVALTRGYADGDPEAEAPHCGTPEPWAELDCVVEEAGWATRQAFPTRGVPQGASGPAGESARASLAASEVWRDVLGREVALRGSDVQTEVTTRVWSLGDRTVHEIDGWIFTGFGERHCGGEDLSVHVRMLVDDRGATVIPARVATAGTWSALVQGAEGVWALADDAPSVRSWVAPTGEVRV
ncbi:MAG: hypothetical protein KC656_34325, partial [Myxococcales bacterium]|nr:hypothetical protein [Myxococcales bacterium]